MSSEQHYAMQFFPIFLLVCLGAPASEGMVSVFTFDSVNVILNSTSHGKLRRFYVLLIRQEAILKMGEGRKDQGNEQLNIFLKQLTYLFIAYQLCI